MVDIPLELIILRGMMAVFLFLGIIVWIRVLAYITRKENTETVIFTEAPKEKILAPCGRPYRDCKTCEECFR